MANEQLEQYISKIEKLNEEIDALRADMRTIFTDAKGNGFSPKAIREVIKLKKMSAADRAEEEFLRDSYKKELGL